MPGLQLGGSRAALTALLAVGVVACADRASVTSPREPADETMPVAGGPPLAVTCTADVRRGALDCGDAPVVQGGPGQQPMQVIVGGQGVFVELVSSNVSYSQQGALFQADVVLRNLLPQGLGSPDGLTVTGIRVFFHTGPTVTAGRGNVSPANDDGTGTFTGTNQPYHLYDEFVPGAAPPVVYQTAVKTWQWNVPRNVETFVFEMYVDADVVNPSGFVVMDPASALLTVGGTVLVSGTPVDVVGGPVGGPVTYSSSEPTIATVDPNTGLVTGVAAGVADIIGSAAGLGDGVTRVTVDPPAGFQIDLHILNPLTPSQETAFTNATARWEQLITGDLATELVEIPFIWCGAAVDEYVDDVAINVLVGAIDGPGGVLGRAGPCWIRSANSLPAFGVMEFDAADLSDLEAGGQLEAVILHEMGHVLGIGTLWPLVGLLQDDTGVLSDCPAAPQDLFFAGSAAVAAFDANGGSAYAFNKVPVEEGGGAGTMCGHWREAVLDDELMTGFIESAPTPNPLSQVTVTSLGDMGFAVAGSGWDAWSCAACPVPAASALGVSAAVGLQLFDDVWRGPILSRDQDGRVVVVRPRRP